MVSGDCNVCINGKMPSYSATCVECGLSRKNYKPMANADRLRAMSDEELASYLCKAIREGFMKVFPTARYSDEDIQELDRDWLDWLRQEVTNDP